MVVFSFSLKKVRRGELANMGGDDRFRGSGQLGPVKAVVDVIRGLFRFLATSEKTTPSRASPFPRFSFFFASSFKSPALVGH
jgi:hypothetical protein